jgi:hypothetical protein
MHKTTILAFATAVLALVTVVTDLVRADAASTSKVSGKVVQQVQIAGAPRVKS